MRLTPGQLRQIIKEELEAFDEGIPVPRGFMPRVRHKDPAEQEAGKTDGVVITGLKGNPDRYTNKPGDSIQVTWNIEDSGRSAKLTMSHRFDKLEFI
jgi:hypothetical protein